MSTSASLHLSSILLVLLAASLPQVNSYTYYYYYYYYPQIPQLPTYYSTPNYCSESSYGYTTACPLESCYYCQTWSRCCINIFQGSNRVYYKECICGGVSTCGPFSAVNTQTINSTTAIPTTTPTTTTQTTTPTTTTPTTTPTTTAPTTTPTTTTPTTTPTTVTTTSTPTTTTTTATTTAPFKSLCPSNFRLLNGNAVTNQCDFPGISNISLNQGASTPCNAVYAPATVNGVKKLTFITTAICKNLITNAKAGTVYDITIGSERLPIMQPFMAVADGPDGTAFLDVNSWYATSIRDLGCQKGACSYNEDTMFGKVNFNECKVVSYGAYDAASPSKTRLSEARIGINPLASCLTGNDLETPANTLCFRSQSGSNVYCSGDISAPVFCLAPSNGEWILIGLTAGQKSCDASASIKVIPIPA